MKHQKEPAVTTKLTNILCTGHGTAQLGCGHQYAITGLQIVNDVYATCPDCGTFTDLTRTYQNLHQIFDDFDKSND